MRSSFISKGCGSKVTRAEVKKSASCACLSLDERRSMEYCGAANSTAMADVGRQRVFGMQWSGLRFSHAKPNWEKQGWVSGP
jgi:hypothetical protein